MSEREGEREREREREKKERVRKRERYREIERGRVSLRLYAKCLLLRAGGIELKFNNCMIKQNRLFFV